MTDMTDLSYRVEKLGGCKIIWGPLPINDLVALAKTMPRGALMDGQLADRIGASLVAGMPAALKALAERSDLPVSPIRQEDAREAHGHGLDRRVARWLIEGERGESSDALCKALHGVPSRAGDAVPHDVSDFHRCLVFLDQTGSREAFSRWQGNTPAWRALVRAWSDIESSCRAEPPGRKAETLSRLRAVVGEGHGALNQDSPPVS